MGDTSPEGERCAHGCVRLCALLLLLVAAAGCHTRGAPIPPAGSEERATRARGGVHEVERGETLWSISRQHGVGVDDLRKACRDEPAAVAAHDAYIDAMR